MSMSVIGKTLILAGGIFILLGAAFLLSGKLPFLGKLPGNILIKKQNFTLYFPLATSILISATISAVLIIINLFRK